MAQCAFLGLGVMGAPMAGHLEFAEHDVVVWNRTPSKTVKWKEKFGGRGVADVHEAVADAEFVFMCLGDDPDVRTVATQALNNMREGAILVDHTTASADLARTLAKSAMGHGVDFIDAPLSGGQAGAENGQLAIMCGGEQTVFDRLEPVMQAYAKSVTLIGPTGSGQLTKMVNQLCIAGVVQGLSEGLHFAQKSGLDVEKVIGAISGGAAQSWQMENRWETMTNGEFDHGFAVDWMRKDLRIALDEARRNGAQLPVGALVDQFYADVQSMGGARWDTSSLIARLERE
jgi:3-hydroxyisobutyrate dehydrogenase-like beta-hydroxyacid dehydrogenase